MALGDLPIGDDAWITLLVRDGEALQPDSDLELRPDDRLLILADPERSHDLKATCTAP